MSPQGVEGSAGALCIGTKLGNGPLLFAQPTLSMVAAGLVLLFMGIKRPLQHNVKCLEGVEG